MKKALIVCCILFCFAVHASAAAFKPEIDLLGKEEISQLSDDKLLQTYIDAVVEIEASKAFHNTSGFTPQDYKTFKDLLRYRIDIIQEIRKRELILPAVD